MSNSVVLIIYGRQQGIPVSVPDQDLSGCSFLVRITNSDNKMQRSVQRSDFVELTSENNGINTENADTGAIILQLTEAHAKLWEVDTELKIHFTIFNTDTAKTVFATGQFAARVTL